MVVLYSLFTMSTATITPPQSPCRDCPNAPVKGPAVSIHLQICLDQIDTVSDEQMAAYFVDLWSIRHFQFNMEEFVSLLHTLLQKCFEKAAETLLAMHISQDYFANVVWQLILHPQTTAFGHSVLVSFLHPVHLQTLSATMHKETCQLFVAEFCRAHDNDPSFTFSPNTLHTVLFYKKLYPYD